MRRRNPTSAARRLVPALVLVAGYALAVRPRLVRWGASEWEVCGPYRGAQLIPGGERSATMAVIIDAEPSRVWPRLLQMGADRAGWRRPPICVTCAASDAAPRAHPTPARPR